MESHYRDSLSTAIVNILIQCGFENSSKRALDEFIGLSLNFMRNKALKINNLANECDLLDSDIIMGLGAFKLHGENLDELFSFLKNYNDIFPPQPKVYYGPIPLKHAQKPPESHEIKPDDVVPWAPEMSSALSTIGMKLTKNGQIISDPNFDRSKFLALSLKSPQHSNNNSNSNNENINNNNKITQSLNMTTQVAKYGSNCSYHLPPEAYPNKYEPPTIDLDSNGAVIGLNGKSGKLPDPYINDLEEQDILRQKTKFKENHHHSVKKKLPQLFNGMKSWKQKSVTMENSFVINDEIKKTIKCDSPQTTAAEAEHYKLNHVDKTQTSDDAWNAALQATVTTIITKPDFFVMNKEENSDSLGKSPSLNQRHQHRHHVKKHKKRHRTPSESRGKKKRRVNEEEEEDNVSQIYQNESTMDSRFSEAAAVPYSLSPESDYNYFIPNTCLSSNPIKEKSPSFSPIDCSRPESSLQQQEQQHNNNGPGSHVSYYSEIIPSQSFLSSSKSKKKKSSRKTHFTNKRKKKPPQSSTAMFHYQLEDDSFIDNHHHRHHRDDSPSLSSTVVLDHHHQQQQQHNHLHHHYHNRAHSQSSTSPLLPPMGNVNDGGDQDDSDDDDDGTEPMKESPEEMLKMLEITPPSPSSKEIIIPNHNQIYNNNDNDDIVVDSPQHYQMIINNNKHNHCLNNVTNENSSEGGGGGIRMKIKLLRDNHHHHHHRGSSYVNSVVTDISSPPQSQHTTDDRNSISERLQFMREDLDDNDEDVGDNNKQQKQSEYININKSPNESHQSISSSSILLYRDNNMFITKKKKRKHNHNNNNIMYTGSSHSSPKTLPALDDCDNNNKIPSLLFKTESSKSSLKKRKRSRLNSNPKKSKSRKSLKLKIETDVIQTAQKVNFISVDDVFSDDEDNNNKMNTDSSNLYNVTAQSYSANSEVYTTPQHVPPAPTLNTQLLLHYSTPQHITPPLYSQTPQSQRPPPIPTMKIVTSNSKKKSASKAAKSKQNINNNNNLVSTMLIKQSVDPSRVLYNYSCLQGEAHYESEDGKVVYICPICNTEDNGSLMLQCDLCQDWYHGLCLGIFDAPPEHLEWFCPRCIEDRLSGRSAKNSNISNISNSAKSKPSKSRSKKK